MRKRFAFVFVSFTFFILVLVAGLYPYTIQQSITVLAPIYEVSPQFTNLKNWKNWHSAFTGIGYIPVTRSNDTKNKTESISLPGNDTYQLTVLNAAAVTIDRTKNGSFSNASISAIPSSHGEFTYLNLTYRKNGFTWLKDKISTNYSIANELNNLKEFMEDDNRRYGYPIKISPVTDTLILTKKMTVFNERVREVPSLLYTQINNYISANNVQVERNYHYVSFSLKDNQTEVAVGIPVNKKAKEQDDYEVLKLPSNGRLLTGKYTGLYRDRNQLYMAMDRYLMDKRLKKVAQPLEKYLNTDTALKDNSRVTLELAYPIY